MGVCLGASPPHVDPPSYDSFQAAMMVASGRCGFGHAAFEPTSPANALQICSCTPAPMPQRPPPPTHPPHPPTSKPPRVRTARGISSHAGGSGWLGKAGCCGDEIPAGDVFWREGVGEAPQHAAPVCDSRATRTLPARGGRGGGYMHPTPLDWARVRTSRRVGCAERILTGGWERGRCAWRCLHTCAS